MLIPAISVAALAAPVAAESETNIETIEVTSGFRTQSLMQTPASLAVIGTDLIEARAAQHLDQILNTTANVTVSTGASRGRFVQIRGIGERSQFQEPINPSVAFIVDDIDFSGMLGAATLFDVSQVEVLKGPQGSRFGASALGGAIYVESNPVSEQPEAQLNAGIGNYNSQSFGAAVSGSLSDVVAARFAINQNQSDGFIKNIHLDRDDTNNIDELSSRLKVSYQPTAGWQFDFAWHHFDIDNGYDAFSLDNNRNTRSDQPGHDKQKTDALSIAAEFNGADIADFRLAVAKSDAELAYGYDEDWTFDGFHPWGYTSFDNYLRDRTSHNLDFRASSKQKAFAMLDWVIGIYAKAEEEALTRQYTYLPADFRSAFTAENRAIYGEAIAHLSEQTRLTLGARYEQRETNYLDNNQLGLDNDDNMLGGRIVLDHQVSDGLMAYASLARGFKAGGVNAQASLPQDKRDYGVEKTTNYELGAKWQVPDTQAYLTASVFHMERSDQQVKAWFTQLREDNSTEFVEFLDNVGSGDNQGVELTLDWQLNALFSVDASFGYLKAEISELILIDGTSKAGREQAQTPTYTYYTGFSYTPNQNWFARLELEGKDDYFFSDSHDEQSTAVDLMHGRIGYQQDNWQVAIWGRNLTKQDYYLRGFGGFGNDPRDGYLTNAYYQLADPRQFGISASIDF